MSDHARIAAIQLDIPLDALRDAVGLVASERNKWEKFSDPRTFRHWEAVYTSLAGLLLAAEVRHDLAAQLATEAQARITALEAQQAQGWQPIETAPKAVTALVAWRTASGSRWEMMTATRFEGTALPGWWAWGNQQVFPTHWMPLPALPVAPQEPT